MVKQLTRAKEEEGEVLIYDNAVIYQRGEYWQFRMWLANENKYARKSLNTKNKMIALERGKEYYLEIISNIKLGKTYFSLTTKEGVEKYLENKEKERTCRKFRIRLLYGIRKHIIGSCTRKKRIQR